MKPDTAHLDASRAFERAVPGIPDGLALRGHRLEGHMRSTLEVILTETPAHLRRQHDPVSGRALIQPRKEFP